MHEIPYSHPAWIEVDLKQFKQNIKSVRQLLQQEKICIPIKANGYGHGLVPIATAAVQAGADYLAVSCLQEGVLLRQAGIQCPILVFGPVYQQQIAKFLTHDLELTISSLAKAKLVAKACHQLNKRANVHIEVDTGMQRTGTRIDTTHEVLNYLEQEKCFALKGIYSHLATADKANNAFAKQQIDAFNQFSLTVKPKYPEALFHLANSGGTCYYPESHLDMVRPGKLLFGYFDQANQATKPVFSIKAKVAYFKVIKQGEGVSYGHTFKAAQDTRIVTVPIGYGDGYRRALSNKAQVLMHGKRYPVAGTICMDQFMVDIGQDSAYVGDEVVLVGSQGNEQITIEEIANLCDTIPSEILCGFNDRLPHLYIDDNIRYWEYNALNHSTILEQANDHHLSQPEMQQE